MLFKQSQLFQKIVVFHQFDKGSIRLEHDETEIQLQAALPDAPHSPAYLVSADSFADPLQHRVAPGLDAEKNGGGAVSGQGCHQRFVDGIHSCLEAEREAESLRQPADLFGPLPLAFSVAYEGRIDEVKALDLAPCEARCQLSLQGGRLPNPASAAAVVAVDEAETARSEAAAAGGNVQAGVAAVGPHVVRNRQQG